MKTLQTFEEFISERKGYGQKITNKEFEKITVGSWVLYVGSRYLVKNNDGFVLELEPLKGGKSIEVNYSMFNQKGAILEEGRVFEAEFDSQRVVIFPGRFQPLHLGHIQALKRTSDIFRVPIVPIQIISKTDKSPFDAKISQAMGDSVAKEYSKWMAGYIVLPSNIKTVIPQMVKYVRETLRFEPIGMGCGSDRLKSYEPQIKYLNSDRSDVPVSEPFRLEMVDERAPSGPSGTRVREAIQNGDRELFEQMTPKSIHSFFDELVEKIK